MAADAADGTPGLRVLSDDVLAELDRFAWPARWPADTVVYREGDAPDALYVILSGRVRVCKTVDDGQEVALATLHGGEFIGESALTDGSTQAETVHTLSECDVLVIPRERLQDLLAECPSVVSFLVRGAVGKIKALNEQSSKALGEKLRLHEDLIRERHRSLSHVAAAANDAGTPEQAYRIVLDLVCERIDWPIGHVYAVDERGKKSLFSRSIWHLPASHHDYSTFRTASEMTHFAPGEGLPGRILASATPLWVDDLRVDVTCPRASACVEAGLVSAVAFPVIVQNQVTAVLEFFSSTRREYDQHLMESLEQLGRQVGRLIERQEYAQRLLHNAMHDPLCGFPNRLLFMDRLGQTVTRAQRDSQKVFAVLCLDVDRFKVVNDSLGHDAGDDLLREFASRLRRSIRAIDTVARLGGDEFAILMDDFAQWSDVTRTVERIQRAVREPILLKDRKLQVSASIGIALSSPGYVDPAEVLRDADTAMYAAKSERAGSYRVFEPSMHRRAVDRLQVESELREALQQGQFRLHYQPILSLSTGQLDGFEALVRWQHPRRGLLLPAEFYRVTEDTEMILPLTDWILGEACRQIAAWRALYPLAPPFSISTNVSARYFGRRDLMDRISSLLASHQLEPASLKVEITEGQILADPKFVASTLSHLSKMGIRVNIDDFGTGFSSLSYLADLPIHGLKIDRSFVSQIGENLRHHVIVDAILSLSEHLNLVVIAEGVETSAQRDYLKSRGCPLAQGFFFARGLEPDQADRFLAPAGS